MLNSVADYIESLDLNESSIWWNKANFFTLAVELSRNNRFMEIDNVRLRDALSEFEKNIPGDFLMAAREAVNGKAQRQTRADHLRDLLLRIE